MLLKEVLLQALYALRTQQFRSTLTLLGIAWGVVTVVLLMAYGNGFHKALVNGFRGAFTEGVTVLWGGQTSLQTGGERSGRRIRLKEADASALLALRLVKHVSPEYVRDLSLGYGNRQTTAPVRGVAPEYAIMRSETAEVGRFISAEDLEQRRRVVFLGREPARKLFGNNPPVGQIVRLQGIPFEVIGVMANKAQISNYYSPDKQCVFIPYTTVQQLWSTEYLDYLVFQMKDLSRQNQALKKVREALAARHGFKPQDERALRTFGSIDTSRLTHEITSGLKWVLHFIGFLTLMIGGVGLMNIMLVSVTERIREIGIRKALGARRSHILLQFLLEGLVITFIGGLLGAGLSYVLVLLIGSRPFLAELLDDVTRQTDIQFRLSSEVLLTATGLLIFVGLLSGLWPAMRAASMNPIDALRQE